MTALFQKPCLVSCLGFIAPLLFSLSALTPQTSRGAAALPALPVQAGPAVEERDLHAGSRGSFAPFAGGWQFLVFPPGRSPFESELLLKRQTTCSVLPASGEGGTKTGDGKK